MELSPARESNPSKEQKADQVASDSLRLAKFGWGDCFDGPISLRVSFGCKNYTRPDLCREHRTVSPHLPRRSFPRAVPAISICCLRFRLRPFPPHRHDHRRGGLVHSLVSLAAGRRVAGCRDDVGLSFRYNCLGSSTGCRILAVHGPAMGPIAAMRFRASLTKAKYPLWMRFITKLRAVNALGARNVVRVAAYRLGLKSGWHPVQQLAATVAPPPFF